MAPEPDFQRRRALAGALASRRADVGHHVDFLAGAVRGGDPSAFAGYVRWTARVLASRGVPDGCLAASLAGLGQALEETLPAGEALALRPYLDAGRAAASEGQGSGPGEPTGPLAPTRRAFLSAILGGHRREAATLALEALARGHAPADLYVEVFQEALYEVGRLWETNRITVAREHMATAITQSVLARVYPRIEPEHPVRGRAVIAGVQGEMHQVGAQMVADLLEADGWDVRFLGANVPHDGVVRAVEEHGAELFGVSCTMLFNVTRVDDLFEAARRSLGSRGPRLLAGGGAFRHSPGLGRELGADGVARDLRDAVALARGLAPGT